MTNRGAVILLCTVVLAISCAPAPSRGSRDGGAPGESATRRPKQITVGILQEPNGWAPWGATTSAGGTLQPPEFIRRTLSVLDDKGEPRADIAVSMPVFGSPDWTANADGSMVQTWKLRANAQWHDGKPVTSDDFVFGWQIVIDPQIPVTDPAPRQITSAEAPDPTTLVLRFAGTTPLAKQALFDPVPRHLLGELYASGNHERFMADQFWTTAYVGAGPYRLAEWSQGAFIRFEAFPGYLFGAPKIDTVILRFLGDQNTLLANVLSGDVEVALPDGISVEQALVLQQGWAAPGTGNTAALYPDGRLYWLEFQEREEYAKPSAARDPRVRAALYHAIDKDGVIQVEIAGLGPQADSWILPDDPNRGAFAAAIPRWAFDLSAAQRMLDEAGWRPGSDGMRVNLATGERLTPELRVTQTAGHVKALSVMGDGWRRAGVDVTETVIPVALNSNGEYRSTFPFAGLSANWIGLRWEAAHYSCASVSSAANRWGSAANRSGYCNPALEPLIDRLEVTIAESDRVALRAQIMQEVLVREHSYLPLYWQVQPIVFSKGVTGIAVIRGGDFGTTHFPWNAHLWDKG